MGLSGMHQKRVAEIDRSCLSGRQDFRTPGAFGEVVERELPKRAAGIGGGRAVWRKARIDVPTGVAGILGGRKRITNVPRPVRGSHRPGPTSRSKASCNTGVLAALTNGSCAYPPRRMTGLVQVAGSCSSQPVSRQRMERDSAASSRGKADSSFTNPSRGNRSMEEASTGRRFQSSGRPGERGHLIAGPAGRKAACGQDCPPHTGSLEELLGELETGAIGEDDPVEMEIRAAAVHNQSDLVARVGKRLADAVGDQAYRGT